MSIELTSKHIKKCRKRHRCEWCGEWIEAGESAHYNSGIHESDFYCYYLHSECLTALNKSDLGYENEFEPMAQKKGEIINLS